MAVNGGTDYSAFVQESFAKVESSFHDISRLNSFTFDEGQIQVCDVFPILPTDELDINVDFIIDTLPLVVKPFCRFSIEIEYYLQYNRDLWKGWEAFVTKGRSGNLSMRVPRVKLDSEYFINPDDVGTDAKKVKFISPHSLASALGVPAIKFDADKPYLPYYHDDTAQSISYRNLYDAGQVNALPFMFYQQIFKYYKLNQNLVQANTNWFPIEGDYDWLLPFAAGDESNTLNTVGNDVTYYSEAPRNDVADGVNLLELRYSQKRVDRFTGALPWLMRGNVPTLETAAFDNFTLDDLNFLGSSNMDGSRFLVRNPQMSDTTFDTYKATVSNNAGGSNTGSAFHLGFSADAYRFSDADGNLTNIPTGQMTTISKPKINASVSDTFGINANQLRSLLALTVWQERNAYTNGSYNEFIKSHYRVNPRADEHIPMYIGGMSTNMYFDEVLQQAVDTSSDATPLGTQVSNGIARSNGYIGHVSSKDFGFVIGIITIRPDNMYTQGLEHFLNQENVMTDYFFPEFAALSPEAVRNSELFLSGDKTVDDDLFGYSRRWSHLIARSNRVGGLFALPSDTDNLFSAYTQAFEFTDTPLLSNQFVTLTPENVRRDMFAYYSQPMFKIQLASRVRGRRPIPYDVRPNTFGF